MVGSHQVKVKRARWWFIPRIFALLLEIYYRGEMIMAALQDLQKAVTNLNLSVTAELKAISDKLASFGDDVKAADVEEAVAAINAVTSKLDEETAALTVTGPTL